MSTAFPPFTHLAAVLEREVDLDREPIRWVLSEGYAAHLAELAGIERGADDEPLEVMGVTAVVLPVARPWELLVRGRKGGLLYVRPGGSK